MAVKSRPNVAFVPSPWFPEVPCMVEIDHGISAREFLQNINRHLSLKPGYLAPLETIENLAFLDTHSNMATI